MRTLILTDTDGWCFQSRAESLQRYAPKGLEIEILNYTSSPIDTICFDKYDLVFCLPTNMVTMLRTHLFRERHSGAADRIAQFGRRSPLRDDVRVHPGRRLHGREQLRGLGERPPGGPGRSLSRLQHFQRRGPLGVGRQRPHRRAAAPGLVVRSNAKIDPYLAEEIRDGREDVKGYYRCLKPLEIGLKHCPPESGWEVDFRIIEPTAEMTQQQMRKWYNSGSYLVIASTSEGTPNIALEAMACGCIPITTRVGNMPELMVHGANGRYVSERNARGFWNGLAYCRARRKEMSNAARATMTPWDWRYRSQWFYKVFELVAGGFKIKPFTYIRTYPDQVQTWPN